MQRNRGNFSDQCKEIEENNRMGKTRDLFKKIRDTKGTFHAKMGSIMDRNGRDLSISTGIINILMIHLSGGCEFKVSFLRYR